MTRPGPNVCPCRNRNKGPEWATDGTGTHETITVDGKVWHVECVESLSAFLAKNHFNEGAAT